jgi:AcrR family transcriptional regulator
MTATDQPEIQSSARKNAERPRTEGRKQQVGRSGWLQAARSALIRKGIAGVQIGRLARRLKVTRGGFYWFFKSRQQLLDELLAEWELENTAAFEAVLKHSGHNGLTEFEAIVDIWVSEERYSPAWDAAMRDWARVSKKVAQVVRRTDEKRLRLLHQIFRDMGCRGDEALVRARICYFHQVGYYALGLRELPGERLRLLPTYIRLLTGRQRRSGRGAPPKSP